MLLSAVLRLGGVLAFVSADLLALPLLLMCRRHFRARAAAFIAALLVTGAPAAVRVRYGGRDEGRGGTRRPQ